MTGATVTSTSAPDRTSDDRWEIRFRITAATGKPRRQSVYGATKEQARDRAKALTAS